jgi:hypothetical protein
MDDAQAEIALHHAWQERVGQILDNITTSYYNVVILSYNEYNIK